MPDQYELGMLFLRYQEFYESPNKQFNNKPFTILEFMNWYRKEMGDISFTYPEDYIGYNIPLESMVKCHGSIPDGDHNTYDRFMFLIITKLLNSNVTYAIGVPNYLTKKTDSTFRHEVAHALWFTNPLYKYEMEQLISKINKTQYAKLTKVLKEQMYGSKHYADEIQAYLSTGLHEDMRKIPGVRDLEKQFKQMFNSFYKPFLKNILKKTAPLKRLKK